MMKILYILISVTFSLFAAVQYNDPDPLLWILIYGSVAIIALVKMKFTQVNFNPMITTLMVIFLLFAAFYVPSFLEFLKQPDKTNLVDQMKAEQPWIEGTRELGGLLFAVLALWYMRQSRLK